MSTTTLKKYKIGRRLGSGVFEKCQTQKFVLSEGRRAKSTRSATARPKRPTDYGLQLIEKQKVRVMYGLRERQFRNYVDKALVTAQPAHTLFQLLESRLDNIVYRAALAPTRRMARQMVSHGHFLVNNKRTTVPSYALSINDTFSVRQGSMKLAYFADVDRSKSTTVPAWVTFDSKKMGGTIVGQPANPDPFLNFQSVIEFYSR